MSFADIHRLFIAPRIFRFTTELSREHLTILDVGEGQGVAAAFRLLQRPGLVPLELAHAGTAGEEEFWALLARATLVIADGSAQAQRLSVLAMAADVPVVRQAGAPGRGPALETLGTSPEELAAAIHLVLEEPWLRRNMVLRQRAFLDRLSHDEVAALFGAATEQGETRIGGWRIEGPFDSSYSLAIVNRSLGLELERQGEHVGLVSMDGPGRLDPDPLFLEQEPATAALWRNAARMAMPDVVTRNLYPPYVLDMRGLTRVLSNYAWEESGFPPAHVAAFNSALDLITVTSHFVKKVLRDNGVRVPIAMVGNGIFEPPAQVRALSRPAGIFRYLHVSSCFPRKGVDVLLAAWAKAFTLDDRVELVIKTFANEHNDVAAQIARLGVTTPRHAPILLIEDDISEDQIHALYASADAVVCPARGEGFGLPMAEAIAHGKPVVTTGFSGQRDFCTPETAWLCDYSFAYSRAHLGISASVWVEPDVDSLVEAMKAVRAATPREVAQKIAAGQALLHQNYRWEVVARKTREAVAALDVLDSTMLRLPKVGWVSTWNTRCGIATYSQALLSGFPAENVILFANRNSSLEGEDTDQVRRCWTLGWVEDDLEELYAAIRAEGVEALVVQFNLSFFPLEALCRLVERLEQQDVPVFLFFHSTMDVERPMGGWVRLGDMRESLARATRLMVHSAGDLNRLKAIGLVENVALFPHGLPEPYGGDRAAVREAMGLGGRTVLATFGFLLPHKGLREIIMAVAQMRRTVPDLHLLMLNALYPADVSREELDICRALVREHGLESHVSILPDFLEDAEIMARLSAADIVVYPYQNTQESASGAVRLGLASGTPVACTPLPIFEDIAPIVRTLPGISPDALACGLLEMLADREALKAQQQAQVKWAGQLIWPIMTRRLEGLVRGTLLDRKMDAVLP
ncbi:glycosyltransferase [Xanthobacter sp. TB0136]|uniref:glycosyltransferase n=1 Tax=Xanthobacter sp. TB0136 TaxID=3459177 RepID=UPI0040392FF7